MNHKVTAEKASSLKRAISYVFWVMVWRRIIIQKDTSSHDKPPVLYSHLYNSVLYIVIFVAPVTWNSSRMKEISKTIYHFRCALFQAQGFDRDFSALLHPYMLHVCVCEHKIEISSCGSAFPWDFRKLPQSWAPGSAGWRARLTLLKLVYLHAVESFSGLEWVSCLITQFAGFILAY